MVTISEAARTVGITRATIHRWLRVRKLVGQPVEHPEGGKPLAVLVNLGEVENLARAITTGRPPREPRTGK